MGSVRQSLAAFGATALEDITALRIGHAGKEAVLALAVSFFGLVCSLRHLSTFID